MAARPASLLSGFAGGGGVDIWGSPYLADLVGGLAARPAILLSRFAGGGWCGYLGSPYLADCGGVAARPARLVGCVWYLGLLSRFGGVVGGQASQPT